jgi:hypothetical protein
MPARCLLLTIFLAISGLSRGGELEEFLGGYRRDQGPFGTVYSHPTDRRERDEVCSEIAARLAQVEARLSRSRGRPFTAVLAPGAAEFTRILRSLTGRRPEEWIAGVAFPDWDLLVVRGEYFTFLKPAGDRPLAVLDHELAHLVIHRREGVRVPRWLDEGLALWAARQFPGPEDEAFLSGLARVGGLYSLEALEREMPKSHESASLAYEESVLWVEWLKQRFGPGVTGDLLGSLEKDETFASALEARTGLSRRDLEAGFRRWLSGRRSIWEVMVQTFNFWTAISVLALVAIARGAWKRRKRLREMEEEEAGDWRLAVGGEETSDAPDDGAGEAQSPAAK